MYFMATINNEVFNSDEFNNYLKQQNINVIKYYSRFGVIIVESDMDLTKEKMKYFESIEYDNSFKLMDDQRDITDQE